MKAMHYTLEQLNQASADAFVAALSGIFEHSPWVAAAAAQQRPFASIDALHRTMSQVVETSGEAKQLALNGAYREKFGFPFILAVRGYDRHGIIANFEARVNNSRADEMRASLDQIYRIARFRLDELIDA